MENVKKQLSAEIKNKTESKIVCTNHEKCGSKGNTRNDKTRRLRFKTHSQLKSCPKKTSSNSANLNFEKNSQLKEKILNECSKI